MKILYSVQATGNGHISRANDVLPLLQKFGEVDVFLSGENAGLNVPFEVKYKSKGCSLFYNASGGLDYGKILMHLNTPRIIKEARELPTEKYDLVINDFECITSLSCKLKSLPSTHFGHQASFNSSKVPRPRKKDFAGEFVLKNYAVSTSQIGLHFKPYDKNIYNPLLRDEILNADPVDEGYILVYLNQYPLEKIISMIKKSSQFQWVIFSKDVKESSENENYSLYSLDRNEFTNAMIRCRGLITGAGFETPAEALFLGKKLMVIPIVGQYEQLCNAEALKFWNVEAKKSISEINSENLSQWLDSEIHVPFSLGMTNEEIVEQVIQSAFLFR